MLDAACELFYAKGVRAVGVDAIVQQSGVAKMTFYKHFPSKDDLVQAMLAQRDREWLAKLKAHLENPVAAKLPAKDRLLAVFDLLEEWYRSEAFRGCAFLNAAAEFPDPAHPVRRLARAHKSRVRDLLIALAKPLKHTDPQKLADQILILVEGATVSAVVWGGPEPARRAKQAAATLIEA